MAEVTTRQESGEPRFVVTYAEYISPVIPGQMFADECLARAVRASPGAGMEDPRKVGERNWTGLLEDDQILYECVLAATAANVAALVATELAWLTWGEEAAELAARLSASAGAVARTRVAVRSGSGHEPGAPPGNNPRTSEA